MYGSQKEAIKDIDHVVGAFGTCVRTRIIWVTKDTRVNLAKTERAFCTSSLVHLHDGGGKIFVCFECILCHRRRGLLKTRTSGFFSRALEVMTVPGGDSLQWLGRQTYKPFLQPFWGRPGRQDCLIWRDKAMNVSMRSIPRK